MLSPEEFTAGTFSSATPGSFILPRTKYEEMALIGKFEDAPAAILLSGQRRFQYLLSSGNNHWKGLIIPNVGIEVDEAAIFDADAEHGPFGALIRTDTRLVIRAKCEQSSALSTLLTISTGLPRNDECSAGFVKWHIILGSGEQKRVLARVDIAAKTPS
jgi:hypothetical protein